MYFQNILTNKSLQE